MINTKVISAVEAAVMAAPARARAAEVARRKEVREATKKLVAEREPRRERRRRLRAEKAARRQPKPSAASVKDVVVKVKVAHPPTHKQLALAAGVPKGEIRSEYPCKKRVKNVKVKKSDSRKGPGPGYVKAKRVKDSFYISPEQRRQNKVKDGKPIVNLKSKTSFEIVEARPLNVPTKGSKPMSRKERLHHEWKCRKLEKELREQFQKLEGSVSKIAA